jgi:DNA invertase Pin-like site-specific DNA recombinase
MAAVAEAEAKAISERTRGAMAAARARGVKLGNTVNLPVAQAKAREAIISRADDRATTVLPIIRQIVAGGENSLHRIADRLNEMGIRTARNASWHGTTVSNMLRRSGIDGLAGLAATA